MFETLSVFLMTTKEENYPVQKESIWFLQKYTVKPVLSGHLNESSFEYPQHMFWFRNKKIKSLVGRPGWAVRIKIWGSDLDSIFCVQRLPAAVKELTPTIFSTTETSKYTIPINLEVKCPFLVIRSMRAYLSLRMGHTPTTYALDDSGSVPFCVSQQILKIYMI